jgi:hypothetical protein
MKVDPKCLKNGDYHVQLELPNGKLVTILIPDGDWWLDEREFGLNLVHKGHY